MTVRDLAEPMPGPVKPATRAVESRSARWAIGAALVWFALHVLACAWFASRSDTPAKLLPVDAAYDLVRNYLPAAARLTSGQPVYPLDPLDSLEMFKLENSFNGRYCPYHPAAFWGFVVLGRLPVHLAAPLWLVTLGAAYVGGVWVWYRVCLHFWPNGSNAGAWLALPFVSFDVLGSLMFGNVEAILFLCSGLLMLCIVRKNFALAGALTAFIVLHKFQWTFPLVFLVAQRQWQLLLRVVLSAAAFYLAANLSLLAVTETPSQAFHVISQYFQFIAGLPARYPFEGKEAMFHTAQNSLEQTAFRYFGRGAAALVLVLLAKSALLGSYARAVFVSSRTRLSAARAFTLTLLSWSLAMLLLPQIQVAMLGGIIVMFLCVQAQAERRPYPLGAAVFAVLAFSELPSLLLMSAFPPDHTLPMLLPLTLVGLLALFLALRRAAVTPVVAS